MNRIQEYDKEGISSKTILKSDADISILIFKLLQALPLRIAHVDSSHSDNRDKPTAWSDTLHDMADALAVQQRKSMNSPDSFVHNSQYRLLTINNIPITRDHQTMDITISKQSAYRQLLC